MGKVVFDNTMSLDGFVAGPNEEVDQLYQWYYTGDTDFRFTGLDMQFRVSRASAEQLRYRTKTIEAAAPGSIAGSSSQKSAWRRRGAKTGSAPDTSVTPTPISQCEPIRSETRPASGATSPPTRSRTLRLGWAWRRHHPFPGRTMREESATHDEPLRVSTGLNDIRESGHRRRRVGSSITALGENPRGPRRALDNEDRCHPEPERSDGEGSRGTCKRDEVLRSASPRSG